MESPSSPPSSPSQHQGITLLLLGPPIDYFVTKGTWVTEYEWTGTAAFWMMLSCSIAILVNISQFMVLGRFTAVTYQVLGHSKTILVLIGGWLVFREVISSKQAGGMAMAVAGMVWYVIWWGDGVWCERIKGGGVWGRCICVCVCVCVCVCLTPTPNTLNTFNPPHT